MYLKIKYNICIKMIAKQDIKSLDLLSNNKDLVYSKLNNGLKNFWSNIFDGMMVIFFFFFFFFFLFLFL